MSHSAPPPRPVATDAFPALVDEVLRAGGGRAAQAERALGQGVDGQGLVRYAAGVASPAERRAIEPQLAGSTWAAKTVANLVRAGRAEGGLARGLLEAARGGALDACKVVARAVLVERGRGALAERMDDPRGETDPVVRGALLLGRGQATDAEALLAQAPAPSSLVDLARRVAASESDPERALFLVLQEI